MKSEKFQEICANVTAAGSATSMAAFGFGAIWYVGGLVIDSIKERRQRRKQEKQDKEDRRIDEEWEAYKMELDEMIQKNQELLDQTKREIEG